MQNYIYIQTMLHYTDYQLLQYKNKIFHLHWLEIVEKTSPVHFCITEPKHLIYSVHTHMHFALFLLPGKNELAIHFTAKHITYKKYFRLWPI